MFNSKNILDFSLVLFFVFAICWLFARPEQRNRLSTYSSEIYLVTNSLTTYSILNGSTRVVAKTAPLACKTGTVHLVEESLTPQYKIQPYYIMRAELEISEAHEQDLFCTFKIKEVRVRPGDEYSWWHVPVHPFAKVITTLEVPDSPLIVDVRSPQEFNSGTFLHAINIPYIIAKASDGKKVISMSEFDFLGDQFPFRKDHLKKPIVIIASTPADNRALRALARLHALGARDLYWIWGGFREVNKIPLFIPSSPSCCTIIEAEQAQELIARGTPIVAVATPLQFNRTHINGALHCSTQDLYSSNECGSLKLNSHEPVILYGTNESSTEVYDFAKKLHEKGWQHIYLLRRGLTEWLGWRMIAPDKFILITSLQYKNPLRNERSHER